MKKIFLLLSLVSCQVYAQAGGLEEKWATLSDSDKRRILQAALVDDSISVDDILGAVCRPRTLNGALAQFESYSCRILPLSPDSRFARYNPAVSGRLVTSVLRSVLTGYALDQVMTPEQQNTLVFDTCNGYLTLARAQLAAAVVEGVYAGYVYGAREGVHKAACETATEISMNAIDTFLERHAPQWLDYPDIVKRNVYVHIIARKCVKILQRGVVENTVRATVGRGVRVGMHVTFGDQ